MTKPHIDAVLELLAGGKTAEAIAQQYGVPVDELLRSRDAYVAGLNAARRTEKHPSRWRLSAAAAAVVLLGVGLWARVAFAATCTQTLPAPLVTFCANNPALASEINGNFAAMVQYITSKVGAVGSSNVTITGATTITGGSNLSGGTSVSGPLSASGVTTFTGPSVNLATPGSGAGGRALTHEAGNVLAINGQGDFSSVSFGTNVRVNGNLVVQGRKSVDGAASTPYDISMRRYVLDVTPAKVGSVVAIDQTMLTELCRDDDGCGFTVSLVNWDGTNNVATRMGHLYYSQVNGSWRAEVPYGGGAEPSGVDGDGALQEVGLWDCYLTDAETATDINNGRSDNGPGLGLLNCRGCTYNDALTTCRIVLRD